MKTANYNLEQELNQLKSKLSNSEASLNSLKTKTDKSIANLKAELKDKESAMGEEVKAHKKDNNDKDDEIKRLNAQIKDNVYKLGKSNKDHEHAVAQLKKEVGTLGGKIDSLEKDNKQISILKEKLRSSQSDLDKLKKQRDEEQRKYKNNLSGESKRIQKEKDAIEYKLNAATAENKKINSLNLKYKQGEEEAKGSMKVTGAVDKAEIKELKANVAALEKEISSLKSKHSRALKDEVNAKESDIKKIEYQNKNDATKLQEEATKKSALLDKEIQGRAYDKTVCDDKLKSLTAQLEEARKGEDNCIPSMYI
eukprot:g7811.t1